MTVTYQNTHPGINEPAAYKLARLAASYDGIEFLEAIRAGESVSGAARFAEGAGRHGSADR